ncbi:MAG: protein translocase subunit SecF [Bdellovibrionales bacterium]|nr:protein translocase subunit SecF [Bdellovibrionales bacterium]
MSKKLEAKIDFLGKAPIVSTISALLALAALVIIMTKGFNYGIDFSGGTEMQVRFDSDVSTKQLREFVDSTGNTVSVQKFGEESEFLLRFGFVSGKDDKETNKLTNDMVEKVQEGLRTTFSEQGVSILRVDTVGPQIGDELKRNGLLAVFYSLIIILIYVGFRFDFKYAQAAVVCLFHDSIVTLGIFSLIGHEVNVQTLAAILTIIGYSLNDTIINFDRVRENLAHYRGDFDITSLMNLSINQVFSRTVLTSLTTLMAVLAMYFLAGGVIKDFAFTLAIGIVIGTFSSIFVASPLVILATKFEQRKKSK